jgi:2-polyprenyl-3-methyl-5-hydroxy-6-metoxy-1,4-benzoquinol methylase
VALQRASEVKVSGAIFRWGAPLFARTAKRWSDVDAEALAGWLGPYVSTGGELLDLGGGTGELARLLAAQLACTVTVADASEAMLRYARDLPGVTAVRAEAASLPFSDGRFDAVLVCDALHHFSDERAPSREMARVVRPGGVVIVEPDREHRAVALIAALERLMGEPAAFLTPPTLKELMRAAGVAGACRSQGRAAYAFVGAVQERPAAGG